MLLETECIQRHLSVGSHKLGWPNLNHFKPTDLNHNLNQLIKTLNDKYVEKIVITKFDPLKNANNCILLRCDKKKCPLKKLVMES